MNTFDAGAVTRFFNVVADYKSRNVSGFAAMGLQVQVEQGFYAAVRSGDVALVTRMLDECPQAVKWQEQSWKDRVDETSGLHIAAARGDIAMAHLLLARGAKVDAKDGSLATPLTHAVCKGERAMVKLLLEHGADPAKRSYLGFDGTLLSLAQKYDHAEIALDLQAALLRKKQTAHMQR